MAENFGYGQMTLADQSSDFNVVAFICRQMIARLETTKLVKVVEVHGGGPEAPPPTVDVQPLVSQVDGFNNAVPHGVVYGLPVLRLQAGGAAIVLDPKVDDVGFVAVADRDISAAKASPGEVVTPGSNRKFDLADGIYVGGILNAAPTSYIHFRDDGSLKIVLANGNVLETSTDGFVLTGNLIVNGSISATTTITGNTASVPVALTTHRHTVLGGVGSTTSSPVP